MDTNFHEAEDIAAAQKSEQEFLADIGQQPKEALTNDDPVQAEPPPVEKKTFNWKFGSNTPPEEEAPKQEQYNPFPDEETGQQGQEKQQSSGTATRVDEGAYYKKCLAIEKMKNLGLSRVLAMLEGTPMYEKYKLSEKEEKEMAEALTAWHPEFVDNMPPWAQYAMINGVIYAPFVLQAYNNGIVNRRNEKARQQGTAYTTNTGSTQNTQSKTDFPPGGERTRFEIHSDGTYQYTRSYPNMRPDYRAKGHADCEKADLNNAEHIKRIILKNGGWKKVATKLNVSEDWMIQRGLNTNNPEIAED